MSHHGCPERLSNRSKGFQEDGASQATMEVLVETLTGTAFEMTVSPSDTILAIKSKIFRVEGIPVSQQHLLYNLQELEDSSSLKDHSITDGSRLRLVLGLKGGPFSTRRLPPPPALDHSWWDIERLLENRRYQLTVDQCPRDESNWNNGCKVTVLVFREGERVNLVRVKENEDGTYSPLEQTKPSSPVPSSSTSNSSSYFCGGQRARDNALTQHKMGELRRRMGALCHARTGEPDKIQKTRSEETLSVPSLFDVRPSYSHYEDTFTYDNFNRFDYSDRYTLLPPIGTRSDSEQSVQESYIDEERLKLSDSLAGSILVKSGLREDDGILEELGAVEELRQEAEPIAVKNLAPVAADNGPLAVGSAWRGFSTSQLASRAPLSSSTSDLETLKRNRLLPTLTRHRPTEHLDLSDELLDRPTDRPPKIETRVKPEEKVEEKVKVKKIKCGFCKKKLTIATVHKCRCGIEFCAPHRYAEVHGCAYDYKANAHQYLQRANPLVSAPKLPKI